jgi:hypothetical protein
MRRMVALFALLGMLALATPTAWADATLAVPSRTQEHSNWCWSASSQMILYFKGQYPTQCRIANYAFSRSDCCSNTTFWWNHSCNSANGLYGGSGTIQGILKYWGVGSSAYSTYLYWSSCTSVINARRPFVMRFGWTSGGGHFLVTYGYVTSGSKLRYYDPWPGEGATLASYSWVVSASDHRWTHTLVSN